MRRVERGDVNDGVGAVQRHFEDTRVADVADVVNGGRRWQASYFLRQASSAG
jgi:hypothetical protein